MPGRFVFPRSRGGSGDGVSPDDVQRLRDILAACGAIERRLAEGDLSSGEGPEFVRHRLSEIGDAVRAIDTTVLMAEPTVPWVDVARMRSLLADPFFDTAHAMIEGTARSDVPRVRAAVERLLAEGGR